MKNVTETKTNAFIASGKTIKALFFLEQVSCAAYNVNHSVRRVLHGCKGICHRSTSGVIDRRTPRVSPISLHFCFILTEIEHLNGDMQTILQMMCTMIGKHKRVARSNYTFLPRRNVPIRFMRRNKPASRGKTRLQALEIYRADIAIVPRLRSTPPMFHTT